VIGSRIGLHDVGVEQDEIGNLHIASGPFAGAMIRPLSDGGSPAHYLCRVCKRIVPTEQAGTCSSCCAVVQCASCGQHSHNCAALCGAIDDCVCELLQKRNAPFARMLLFDKQYRGPGYRSVAISMFDALRCPRLPTDILHGLTHQSAQLMTHSPRLVARALLREIYVTHVCPTTKRL
jgi:hypothetical protein